MLTYVLAMINSTIPRLLLFWFKGRAGGAAYRGAADQTSVNGCNIRNTRTKNVKATSEMLVKIPYDGRSENDQMVLHKQRVQRHNTCLGQRLLSIRMVVSHYF